MRINGCKLTHEQIYSGSYKMTIRIKGPEFWNAGRILWSGTRDPARRLYVVPACGSRGGCFQACV